MTIDSHVKPNPPEQLFDIMDVAGAIGACRGTVRGLLAAGQLKAVKLGGFFASVQISPLCRSQASRHASVYVEHMPVDET